MTKSANSILRILCVSYIFFSFPGRRSDDSNQQSSAVFGSNHDRQLVFDPLGENDIMPNSYRIVNAFFVKISNQKRSLHSWRKA